MPIVSRLAGVLVLAWALGWFLIFARGGGMAWHYFETGDSALANVHDQVDGGLHLYAALPYLQIGPLALAASFLLQHLTPDDGLVAAQLVGASAGAVLLLLVRSIARGMPAGRRPREVDRLLGTAAVFFVPVWMYAAVRSTHLDDVLALLCGVVALKLAVDGRAIPAGAAVALAVDAKPWALPFACVLILLPTARRRLEGFLAAAAVCLAAWLPFVLADSHTWSSLSHFTIRNQPTSVLRLIGVTTRTPVWDRPAQAALGVALAGLAIHRGRWPAILLLVMAARVVLDPGVNRYYIAGIAVGALIWDVVGSRLRQPWWCAATLVLFASRWHHLPTRIHASLTLGFFLAAVTFLVLWPPAGASRLPMPRDPPPGIRSGASQDRTITLTA